jgi:hypothetical protein
MVRAREGIPFKLMTSLILGDQSREIPTSHEKDEDELCR